MTLETISETPPGWAANCAFAPDALRGARLDMAVRAGLADSLTNIFDSLDPPGPADASRRAALLDRLAAGPVSPGLFAVYVDLVLAIFADRDRDAEALLDELLGPWPVSEGLRIVTLDDAELGHGQSARYQQLLSDDIACAIESLRPDALKAAAGRLTQGLDLLQAGAPDLFGEFRALVRQVVLVAPGAGPQGFTFGGASTFSLWGALVLNAEGFGDRLGIAVSLAHEAAHTHLFGLALGGRLTENDEAERYPSPLRRDTRPMEGVAHAAYVTARMVYALKALIASGELDAREAGLASDRLAMNEAALAQGLATVMANARFTPVGAAAFEGLQRSKSGS